MQAGQVRPAQPSQGSSESAQRSPAQSRRSISPTEHIFSIAVAFPVWTAGPIAELLGSEVLFFRLDMLSPIETFSLFPDWPDQSVARLLESVWVGFPD